MVEPNSISPQSFPLGIAPRYTTAEPNSPIELYRGEANLDVDGHVASKEATVCLEWLPRPHIQMTVLDYDPLDSFGKSMDVSLRGRPNHIRVFWTSVTPRFFPNGPGPRSAGKVTDAGLSSDENVARIQFHLANGPEFKGEPIRDTSGDCLYTGRATFGDEYWRIVIDCLCEQIKHNWRKRLTTSAGYAITHVGILERTDGTSFPVGDAHAVLDTLGWLLSFCCGGWAYPILLVGLNNEGDALCEEWRCHLVSPMRERRIWFDRDAREGFDIFGAMHEKRSNEQWREPIDSALLWYLTCNQVDEAAVRGAIVLQQAALELLAWTLLVEDQEVLSEDGARKSPAFDRIRRLLSFCGISHEIPSTLSDLTAVAKELNWADGPAATTGIRNALVHSSAEKRARIRSVGPKSRFEAWALGQWYLELVLLRLFGYEGRYANRLHHDVWRGEDVELVPWAAGQP